MAITNTYGRAEFKPESDVASCFEGVPALALLSPLFTDWPEEYGRVRELVGSRGTGKTHLLRLLSLDVPLQLNELDKGALQNGEIKYGQIATHPEPVAIVVDDLHYLLKAMYVSRLKGGRLAEEKVLDRLGEFKTLADTLNALLIFAADEGPAGLSMRFEMPENKKRFLKLMEGCAATGDDMQAYYRAFGKFPPATAPFKAVNIDYRGSVQTNAEPWMPPHLALRIWPKEFVTWLQKNWWETPAQITEPAAEDQSKLEQIMRHTMRDAQRDRCEICQQVDIFTQNMKSKLADGLRQSGNSLARQLGVTDIPLAVPTIAYDKSPKRDRALYTFSKHGRLLDHSRAFRNDGLSWQEIKEPLSMPMTIRELEIVVQACGGISREALGLANIGRATKEYIHPLGERLNSIIYTRSELGQIYRRVRERFNSAVKFDPTDLMTCFYYAQTDEELLVGMVEADLGLE